MKIIIEAWVSARETWLWERKHIIHRGAHSLKFKNRQAGIWNHWDFADSTFRTL